MATRSCCSTPRTAVAGGARRLRRQRHAARRSVPVPQRQSILPGTAPDLRLSRVSVSIRRAKAVPWKLQSTRNTDPKKPCSNQDPHMGTAEFPAKRVNQRFQTGRGLIAGVWLVDRRPTLAGACIGTLAIKPQLGILLPFAL